MSGSWRWWLVIPAVALAFLVAACGDDDEGPSDAGPADEGVAAEEPAEEPEDGVVEEEPSEDGIEIEAGGEAFDDVPLPGGASVISSGEWSGTIPGMVTGMESALEDFTTLEYLELETDDSPEDVINFYRDELSDWEELFVFSGGADEEEGGVGVWMRDDVAVWVTTGSADGATEVIVIRASR
jgi:hypothetical protein